MNIDTDRHLETPFTVSHVAILRTVAAVYRLPDPSDFATTEEWQLATEIRTGGPNYSPSTRMDGETT